MSLTKVVGTLLYYGQRALIYPAAFFGTGHGQETPFHYAHPYYEDLKLDTPDGIKIHCFLMKQRNEQSEYSPSSSSSDEYAGQYPTIILFHGNAETMDSGLPWAIEVYRRLKCNIIMMSYRGFGQSQGKPSEKGIRLDTQTVLNYLTSHPMLNAHKRDCGTPFNIILYGRSLGGGIALDLAARNPDAIRAIILENTFVSIRRVIKDNIPILKPFRFLCHQRWESAAALKKIPPTVHLLMLSGLIDRVIPPSHMKELWEISQNNGRKNATWKEFPSGGHNDTQLCAGYKEAIYEFIHPLVESSPSKL